MEQGIFLVGPMGAGKTTAGKRLAKAMKREFFDCDHVIEDRTGVDIAYIFEREGEAGFRDRESCALDDLTQKSEIVLATGGGAVLRDENRCMLRSRGIVIYLETSVDQQLKRMRFDRKRPLLQSKNRREQLEAMREQRDPLYRDVADIVVSTDRYGGRGLARELMKRVKEYTRQ